jgi:hypothetical protein
VCNRCVCVVGEVASGSGSGARVTGASATGTYTIDRLAGVVSIGTSTIDASAVVVQTAATVCGSECVANDSSPTDVEPCDLVSMVSSHVNHLEVRSPIFHLLQGPPLVLLEGTVPLQMCSAYVVGEIWTSRTVHQNAPMGPATSFVTSLEVPLQHPSPEHAVSPLQALPSGWRCLCFSCVRQGSVKHHFRSTTQLWR